MHRLMAALASVGCIASLAGCYNGKGTESEYATAPPAAMSSPAASVVTGTMPISPSGRSGLLRPRDLRFSFSDQYAQGSINSEAVATTPNHRGALVMPVRVDGVPANALTILASYRYSYHLAVPPSSMLAFTAGRPYNIGTPTRGFVDIDAGGEVDRVFQADLAPSNDSGIQWHRFSKSLDSYAGKNVMITFGADATGSDMTAAWVEFPNAGIYAEPAGRRGKK